jgi:hypothetical protein
MSIYGVSILEAHKASGRLSKRVDSTTPDERLDFGGGGGNRRRQRGWRDRMVLQVDVAQQLPGGCQVAMA